MNIGYHLKWLTGNYICRNLFLVIAFLFVIIFICYFALLLPASKAVVESDRKYKEVVAKLYGVQQSQQLAHYYKDIQNIVQKDHAKLYKTISSATIARQLDRLIEDNNLIVDEESYSNIRQSRQHVSITVRLSLRGTYSSLKSLIGSLDETDNFGDIIQLDMKKEDRLVLANIRIIFFSKEVENYVG